ncbi:MAG: DUF4365 domain-containing protein [Thermoguttaceae bacterium]|jgi:hypothetical protein|nr:DUF4365 domain-containing protein [Thermoguttaceae bacterium]
MSTKRKKSAGTSSEGVHYVGGVVARHNGIFQKIDEGNDQGHDAYIEFISGKEATSLFAWVQIKSGVSYRRKGGYAIPADKDHFDYWKSSPAPVVGIVYDPDLDSAVWINISEYLHSNPDIAENGPYSIRISAENEFSARTFDAFKKQLLAYNFSSNWHFGQSLVFLSDTGNQERCVVGMSSLFAYHRHRKATWFYLIHCFPSIDGAALVRLTQLLSHLPGHPYLFWHGGNIIEKEVETYGKELLANRFGRKEVLKLIGLVDSHAFSAGSIGYTVSTLAFLVCDAQDILEGIAFDDNISEEQRGHAIFLLIHYAQFHSVEFCIEAIARFVARYPNSDDCELFRSMKETLEKEGFLGYIGT